MASDSTTPPGKGKTVLISGGSIAGPAVAWWLNKYGFETTLVERWNELRPGGQNIDIRGVGRDIIQKMGLFEALKAKNTSEEGTQFIRADGSAHATFPASANGPTAELEILRGDLAQVLYDATKENTNYVFGDFITAINDEEKEVTVTFSSGRKENFHVVVIADGVRSGTRTMVFGDEVEFKSLACAVAYGTLPRVETDSKWWNWYTAPGRRVMSTRPDPYGSTRFSLTFMDSAGYKEADDQGRIDILRRKFAGAGWEADRILAALDNVQDLYCDDLVQVKAPRYSAGRVVMIGDAAYCATPISGQGTTLSLSGAYILASELAKSPNDHLTAFKRYDHHMRPIATKAQQLPPGTPGIAHPETLWQVAIFQTVVSVAAFLFNVSWPAFVTRLFNKLELGTDKIKVPQYEEL